MDIRLFYLGILVFPMCRLFFKMGASPRCGSHWRLCCFHSHCQRWCGFGAESCSSVDPPICWRGVFLFFLFSSLNDSCPDTGVLDLCGKSDDETTTVTGDGNVSCPSMVHTLMMGFFFHSVNDVCVKLFIMVVPVVLNLFVPFLWLSLHIWDVKVTAPSKSNSSRWQKFLVISDQSSVRLLKTWTRSSIIIEQFFVDVLFFCCGTHSREILYFRSLEFQKHEDNLLLPF